MSTYYAETLAAVAARRAARGEGEMTLFLVDYVLIARSLPPIMPQEIAQERRRQNAKWGGARHDDAHTAAAWSGFQWQRVWECERAAQANDNEGVRRYALQFHALRRAEADVETRRNRRRERRAMKPPTPGEESGT